MRSRGSAVAGLALLLAMFGAFGALAQLRFGTAMWFLSAGLLAVLIGRPRD